MPQTTAERAARWPGYDEEAVLFLRNAGYTLNCNWSWTKPTPGHIPTERELDAVIYLVQEWDYNGLEGEPWEKFAGAP